MTQDVNEFMKNLKISDSLKDQLAKKEYAIDNLRRIAKYTNIDKNIYYNMCLAITDLEDVYVKEIVNLIEQKIVINDNMLNKCIELGKGKKCGEEEGALTNYVKSISFDECKLRKVAEKFDNLKDVMNYLSKDDEMAFYDPKRAISVLKSFNVKSKKIERKGILNEGKLRYLHKAGENPQISEEILQAHLKRTDGEIITRFPPEPNGYLHIGHAKAMYLDFNFGNRCILRYDDTNPKNEMAEYYESILEDVRWMGYTPWKITRASDYFDELIDFARRLVRDGKAYVCHLSTEEIKAQVLSPYRNRSPEVNLALFEEMISGKWKEGTAILRLKMDMDSKNMLMHDLIAYRIIDKDHLKADKKYYVYPSYDYTHCINDSLEDITHSFCSREFFSRRVSYYWLLDNLRVYKPVQWEFSRLNISNTVLSKRKLNALIAKGIVMGWDDPRLFTLRGLRRRGVPPQAINAFVEKVGITFNESIVDVRLFENIVRDFLKDQRIVNVIYDPIEMKIEDQESILIDGDDFREKNTEDFLRLTYDQPVGLVNKYAVELVSIDDRLLKVRKTARTFKSRIHWLTKDAQNVKIRVRELSHLFRSFNPEEKDFLEDVDPDSMQIVEGLCEPGITDVKVGEVVQFFRKGWYCRDEDENGLMTFNKTVGMKK
ncbi:Glutaminyl-tRNA synthetase [Trachipleistophora hominis]|uniref:glutamine--tRNA ligase n=1 Tax=Trachipleistophora hominis TaxID=72359 RepID=L7JR39_TRAHO|nr:Glutaminyl-tRNA synthetase [Trachipleistophora hominis]